MLKLRADTKKDIEDLKERKIYKYIKFCSLCKKKYGTDFKDDKRCIVCINSMNYHHTRFKGRKMY